MVDFSKARLLDRSWWMKLKLILNGIDKENLCRVRHLRHNQHLAVVAASRVDDKTFDNHWEAANNELAKFTETLFPWYGNMSTGEQRKRMMSSMRSAWARRWGDPSDPAVQAKVEATAKAMLERQAESHRKRKKTRSALSR